MSSLVAGGMESATGERFMTRETVAGESPKCSATDLRLACRGAFCATDRDGRTDFRFLGGIMRKSRTPAGMLQELFLALQLLTEFDAYCYDARRALNRFTFDLVRS